MLRKVGRKRARVPLTREGVNSALPHADGWVGMDEVCGLTSGPTMLRLSGFRSWFRLQASRISPAFVRVSLLTTGRVRGVFSRPFPCRCEKSPHQIVRITDRDLCECKTLYRYERYAIFTLDNPNLSGAKLRDNSRPAMGH
jgi:hypothetical protein